jgi:hypothetical protein
LYKTTATVFLALIMLPSLAFAQDAARIDPASIPRGSFVPETTLPVVNLNAGLLEGLSSVDRSAILGSGELVYRHDGDFVPALLPGSGSERAAQAAAISEHHRESRNNFALEVLMLLEIPGELKNEVPGGDVPLHIYNVLHRISTLAGLDYFSASRGRLREFYLTSSVVDEDGLTPLPDPVFDQVRREYRFTIRQEDASFGDNLYEVVSSPDSISIRNLTPIVYNFIRVANPGDLELQMKIIPDGDRLLFYAFSSLKAPRIFGIRDRLGNSFYNRITALYGWFADQIVLTEI